MANLLTVQNAKTSKGEKFGYLTGILYLLPFNLSGLRNVCQWASNGCKAVCLNWAGRGAMGSVQKGRMRKTQLLYRNREGFMVQLHKDIASLIRKATREGLIPCVRLDGTSDLGLAIHVASAFPTVQFYDYTKSIERVRKYAAGLYPTNYHLTFSRSESNATHVQEALALGVNVAVPFMLGKNDALPSTWQGVKVVDGDVTDLRFLDPKGGVIVGLKAKGKAKKDTSGFVVRI